MAHALEKDTVRYMWGGRYRKAVEEERVRFLNDPTHRLVAWISALYSARSLYKYRFELYDQLKPATEYASKTLIHGLSSIPQVLRADPSLDTEQFIRLLDEADVLSTVFEWANRDGGLLHFNPHLAEAMRPLAEEILATAMPSTALLPSGHHTHVLLLLTRSRIFNDETDLIEAENHAALISSPEQRERAYRKIGMLWRLKGNWRRAFKYGFQALVVPHTGWEAKVKSLAVLAGIDR